MGSPGHSHHSHHGREAGAASLAETVLVAPALLFTLMLIVQFGLMFHARNIAENAAQEGAAAARRFDGTAADARATANTYLKSTSGTLGDTTVTATRTADTATVTVTGTVISLVPGLHLHVDEAETGPVERYVNPSGEQDQQQ